ncbi:MAG TPA: VWA domain-containing protein, partial [Thermoanaerobaculia bacterium]|nr:VWA domain-containing protein [Thermoanaerobaculia bacterium]
GTAAPRQPRTIVIFLEQFRLPEFRVKPLFASLKELVRKTVEEGDAVTVITYREKPEVRIDGTDDVEAISAVIDEVARESVGVAMPSAAMAYRQAKERREFEAGSAEMAARAGVQAAAEDPETIAVLEAKPFAIQARDEMRRRVNAINGVIQRLAGIEGRKVLLLATHRLGAYAGAEFFFAAGLNRVPAMEHDEFDNRDEVRAIIDSANDAGVTIYPFYPAGLDVEALGTELHLRRGDEVVAQNQGVNPEDTTRAIDNLILINENSMLTEVAAKTGGVASWGTANIANLLPRIADDMTDYYSLAYRVTAKRDGVPRQIVVKTKNRAYQVRARREVVEKSDDVRMKDRVAAAVFGTATDPAFPIVAEVEPVTNGVAPLKVRVPIASLTLVPAEAKFQGAFSVYVVTANAAGDLSDVTRHTQTFDIAETDLERADGAHFTYELGLRVPNTTTRIGVGVMDEVSKSYGLASVSVTR